VPAGFSELACAVQRVDDPHPIGRVAPPILGGFLIEHGVVGSQEAELVSDELVAGQVAVVHHVRGMGTVGPHRLTQVDQQLAGLGGQPRRQLTVGLARHGHGAKYGGDRSTTVRAYANICSMSSSSRFVNAGTAGPPVNAATILHADLDSFYASVEQRDDPALRDRPVVVGGGIVLAASYEAKRRGVYTPMPEFKARRLCPDLIVVPPRFDAYIAASKAVFEVFRDTTPNVEGLSIDEAFLDVSGLWRIAGAPVEIAGRLREQVRREVGLAITVGVARTKFLAKVASGVAKPDGLLLVEPDRELDFLHPLPVGRLWGVGSVTERKLHERGIYTVGEVALLEQAQLVAILGVASGRHLHALAHNRDPRRVETGKRRGSIGSQSALGRRPKTPESLESLLLGIVDRVTRRMRKADRAGRTITLRFRYDDFTRVTRARSLAHPTAATQPIAEVALAVLRSEQSTIEERGLTLLGLSVGNLVSLDATDVTEQLELPFGRKDRSQLDGAVDDLQRRFGNGVLTRAALLGRSSGFDAPMLPD